MNYTRTALLLAAMTGIFVAMGALIGGQNGMLIAFAVALVMNVFSLWKSDKLVLRMFGAQEVDAASAPEYYGLVQTLAHRAELPMPRVYVMDNPQPNAFATGRSPAHSAVCTSTGLIDLLSREELAGVIAHELAHIKNRDTLTMTVAATIGGAISMLAQYLQFGMMFGGARDSDGNRSGPGILLTLVAAIVAPIAATLVQMAISRSREYQADRLGAMICGNPLWLAGALSRIQNGARQVMNMDAERIPAAAHLFIINPLTGRGVDNLFSTHPNTENRIAALQDMAREWGGAAGSAPLAAEPYAEPGTTGPWSGGGRAARGGPWG